MRPLRQRIQSEQGYTLSEVLVVILIITILTAIALVAFLSQREKAQDTEAKAAARTAATAMMAWYSDNRTFSGATVAELRKIEPSLGEGQGSTLTISDQSDTGYQVTVTSKAGTAYSVSDTKELEGRSCSPAGRGGCPASGRW